MKVGFVVNGSEKSAMGWRARGLATHLPPSFQCSFVYRGDSAKLSEAKRFMAWLDEEKPDVAYVLDMAVSGAVAGLIRKAQRRFKLVIDTGDAITALARSAKLRGPLGIAATWLLEEAGLRAADALVVRGTYHKEVLAERGIAATVIPDGFEREWFYSEDAIAFRQQKAIPEGVCVGLLGSVIWNGAIESTYGWDLVEILAALPDLSLSGLMIGDGSGLPMLKEHARKRNVLARIHFAGRVAYKDLCPWLNAMDVGLSTQTNDLPGRVRTTGKLPLYLGCGRFILASNVGEASRVLPARMLVDYEGSRDPQYPAKAATRLRMLIDSKTDFVAQGGEVASQIAMNFEYRHLSEKLAELLNRIVS